MFLYSFIYSFIYLFIYLAIKYSVQRSYTRIIRINILIGKCPNVYFVNLIWKFFYRRKRKTFTRESVFKDKKFISYSYLLFPYVRIMHEEWKHGGGTTNFFFNLYIDNIIKIKIPHVVCLNFGNNIKRL